ncbi:Melatonin-related receptor [Trichinella pseudospiralis]|uniref:Melatonin-related receptor n=1 Tax=Trichinella pseudospiralis TaxID=6337 RepID=A0A0V1FY68_TRIPS|nr:Melatonin-related receptor [Trichinella pseudospiralis]
MDNMTKESEADLKSDTFGDSLVVTVWAIASIYGIVTNLMVLLAITRHRAIRHSASYWIMASLAVCDIVMLFVCLLHVIPATLWHQRFMEIANFRNIIGMFIYNVFWYSGVVQLAAMAINRFVSIIYPMTYKRVFSKQNTVLVLAFCYLLGLGVSIPALLPCCYTIYHHYLYVTMYVTEDTMYFLVDVLVNSLSLLTMSICYGAILIKVRRSHQTTRQYMAATPRRIQPSNREMRLFVQFFFVSLVFLITFVTWQWLPRISVSKWIYFVCTSLFFLNNCMNPTVYIIFNSLLRKEMLKMICWWQKVTIMGKNINTQPMVSSDEMEASKAVTS